MTLLEENGGTLVTLVNAAAIVSGSARGIGAAAARALVQSGACVVTGDALEEDVRRKALAALLAAVHAKP